MNCFQDFEDPKKFFNTIERQSSSPFWVHQQKIIRQEFQQPTVVFGNSDEETDVVITANFKNDEELEGVSEEDQLVVLHDELAETCDVLGFLNKMNRSTGFITEHYSISKIEFAKRLIQQNIS